MNLKLPQDTQCRTRHNTTLGRQQQNQNYSKWLFWRFRAKVVHHLMVKDKFFPPSPSSKTNGQILLVHCTADHRAHHGGFSSQKATAANHIPQISHYLDRWTGKFKAQIGVGMRSGKVESDFRDGSSGSTHQIWNPHPGPDTPHTPAKQLEYE